MFDVNQPPQCRNQALITICQPPWSPHNPLTKFFFPYRPLRFLYIVPGIYIYPQTGTFADPETHPLRAFVPFLPRAVLALGPQFFAFLNASLASVHTWNGNMLIPVFKVLRNGLLRYILHTCPNLQCNPCSKCYGMDCFGTYFTHAQTCNVTRVQSATEWTASVHTLHMPKHVM